MAIKFSKKERNEIYSLLLNRLYEAYGEEKYFAICGHMADYLPGGYPIHKFNVTPHFPEFALFRPNENTNDSESWFLDNQERYVCLLLCIEMTK